MQCKKVTAVIARQGLLLCRARIIITSSTSVRGKKTTPLKQVADQACSLAAKADFKVSPYDVYPCTHS